MAMYDRILVPTDGSEVANSAAAAAVALADRFGAELIALHVLEPGEEPPARGVPGTAGTTDEPATEAVASRAAAAGVDARTVVLDETAAIHEAIVAYATDNDVDLLVMGTHGRMGLDRFVLGSVAERTFQASPIPVLTVHEETVVSGDFESILFPTDGSEAATAAGDHAIALADAAGAELHVVHAVQGGIVAEDLDPAQLLDALETAGRRALDAAVDRATDAGLAHVEASLVEGRPHEAIVDYAAENDVDCIVMGTHGRSGIDRFLLGSVAERVVRLADVPVIVQPAPDEGT